MIFYSVFLSHWKINLLLRNRLVPPSCSQYLTMHVKMTVPLYLTFAVKKKCLSILNFLVYHFDSVINLDVLF